MGEQISLTKLQDDIESLVCRIKTKSDTSEIKSSGNQLLTIRESIIQTLNSASHNQKVLQKDRSSKLNKVQQITNAEMAKVKKLLVKVDSALNYCHRLDKQNHSGNETVVHGKYDAVRGHNNPAPPFRLTSQTVRLLDIERYGTAEDIKDTTDFPVPDLGLATNQRNCSIAEKIRVGSDNFTRKSHKTESRIGLPLFYRNFCREED